MRSRKSVALRFTIPVFRTREFWDSLRKGRFVTTKCTDCGKLSFPPQADCPHCMSPRFAWESIGPEATLVTYTVVKMAPASFAQKAPYIVAIGEFVGGIRVLAWLEGIDPDKVEPGMRVRIETRTYDEGFPCYVFVSEGSN